MTGTQIVREALIDGRRVAVMRCFDGDGATIVEVEVMPTNSDIPVSRGPYRFATAHEAFRFMQEALLALQYLGCSVVST